MALLGPSARRSAVGSPAGPHIHRHQLHSPLLLNCQFLTMTSQKTSFKHATLGTFHGVTPLPEVVQYRCIPFASIPARFKHSKLIDHVGEFDATQLGPICPQMKGFVENQAGGWGGKGGPTCPPLEENEFECLRLTITAPQGHHQGQKLPVMVWVHGGAMTAGAGASLPRESCENLVAQAASLGQPVIAVAIQYRVGWLGFLTSKDFEQEPEHYEDGLGPGMWGIIDQRNAFLWIKKHIAGFGGDPTNITAFGESAGSISICYHMCSTVPNLFNRAILQSGTAASLSPLSVETYDKGYRKLLPLLGISLDLPLEKRLEKLRSVEVTKFIDSYDHLNNAYPAFPGSQGWFWREPVDGQTGGKVLAGCDWVNEVIIGDCLVEGKIFQRNVATDLPDPLTALLTSADKLVPASDARDAVLKAYSIVKGTTIEKVVEEGTLLAGDLVFQALIRDAARHLVQAGKKVYYYHWDYPNPWPVPFFGGVPHHFIDVLFVFQTLKDVYPTPLASKIAVDSGKYWVTFAAKGKPEGWKEFNNGYVAVVDPNEGWIQKSQEEDRKNPVRREDRWDLLDRIQPYGQTWGDQMSNRRDGFWT